jgi:hypothetical protein
MALVLKAPIEEQKTSEIAQQITPGENISPALNPFKQKRWIRP